MKKNALIYLLLITISAVSSFNFNRSRFHNEERKFDSTGIFTGLSVYYNIETTDTITLKQNGTSETLNFTSGFRRSNSFAHISLNFPRLPSQLLKKSVCYLISSYFKFNIKSVNVVYLTPSSLSSIKNTLNLIRTFNCEIMVYISESYSLLNIFNWCKNNFPQLCKYTWFSSENVINSRYYSVYSFHHLLLDEIDKIDMLLMYINSIKKRMEDMKIKFTLSNIHKFIKNEKNVNKYNDSYYITYNIPQENPSSSSLLLLPESPLYHNGMIIGKCNIYSCEIDDSNYFNNNNNRIKENNNNNNNLPPTPPIEECLCRHIYYCLLDNNNRYQCKGNFHNFAVNSRYNGFEDAFNLTWVIVQYIIMGVCVIFMIATFFLRKHRFMVYQNWILDWCIMIGTIICCVTSLLYILFVFKRHYSTVYKYAPLQLYFLAFEMIFGAEALVLNRVCKRITKRQSTSVIPEGTVVVGGVSYKRGSCVSKQQQQQSIHQSQIQITQQNNQSRNQSTFVERSKKTICAEENDPTLIPQTLQNDNNQSQQPLQSKRPSEIDTNVPNAIRITVSPTQTPARNITPRSVGVIMENNNNNNNNNSNQNQASSSGTGNSSSKSKAKPPKVSLSAGQLFMTPDTLQNSNNNDKRFSVGNNNNNNNTPIVDSGVNTPNRIAVENLEKRLGRKRTVNLSVCKNAPPPTQQIQLSKKEWIIYFTAVSFYIVLCAVTIFVCPYEIRIWRMSIMYDSTEDILNGIDPSFTILDGLYVHLYEATSYICFILWVFQVAYFIRELIVIFTDGEKLNVYESVLVTCIYLSLICFGCLLAVIMLVNVDSRTSGFVLLGLSLVYCILSLYGTGYPLLCGYINPKKETKAVDAPGSDIRCVECGYLLDYLLVPNRNKDRFKMGCPDAQNTNKDMTTARSALKNTLTNMLRSGRKDSTNPNTERRSYNNKRTSATRRASNKEESNSGTRKNSVARSRNSSVIGGIRRSSCNNNNNSAAPTPLRGRSSTSDGRDSVHSDAGGCGTGGGRKSISDEVQIIKGKSNNNNNILMTPTLHTIPENEAGVVTTSQMHVRNSTTPSNMAGIESIRVGTNDDGNINDDQPPPSQHNDLYNAIAPSSKLTGNDFGIESHSTVPVIPKQHAENKILDGIRLDGSLKVESFSNSSSPLLQKDSKRVLLEPLDLEKQKNAKKK